MTRSKRREEEDEDDTGCARTILFVVSAFGGIIYLVGLGRIGVIEVLIAFAIMLLYPLVGASVVGICELIRDFAFPKATEGWSREEHLVIAAIWPISLLYWLVVGPAFAIINRVFR